MNPEVDDPAIIFPYMRSVTRRGGPVQSLIMPQNKSNTYGNWNLDADKVYSTTLGTGIISGICKSFTNVQITSYSCGPFY